MNTTELESLIQMKLKIYEIKLRKSYTLENMQVEEVEIAKKINGIKKTLKDANTALRTKMVVQDPVLVQKLNAKVSQKKRDLELVEKAKNQLKLDRILES